MADRVTSLLQLIDQETGANNNSWGDIADANFAKLETAIAGATSLAVTGGTRTLTDDESRNAILRFTGTLTSNQIIVVPNRSKIWIIVNETSGAFSFKIKTNAQLEANAPSLQPNSINVFSCNGSSVSAAFSIPDGSITAEKIGANAVTGPKIAPGAVTPPDLSTGGPSWDAAGNVGVGTSNPAARLEVRGANTPSVTVRSEDSSAARVSLWSSIRLWTINANGSALPSGAFFIADETLSAVRLVISASGDVGIGTSSPGSKLEVNGAIRATGINTRAGVNGGPGANTFNLEWDAGGNGSLWIDNVKMSNFYINQTGIGGNGSQLNSLPIAAGIVAIPDRGVGTFISVVNSANVYAAGTNYPGSGRLPAGGTWRCQYESRWFVQNIDDFSVFSFKRVG
jgi:hypothetical protein